MHINGSNTYPRQILYGIGFTVPCIATTFSYLVIWYYMWSNHKYLKTVGHRYRLSFSFTTSLNVCAFFTVIWKKWLQKEKWKRRGLYSWSAFATSFSWCPLHSLMWSTYNWTNPNYIWPCSVFTGCNTVSISLFMQEGVNSIEKRIHTLFIRWNCLTKKCEIVFWRIHYRCVTVFVVAERIPPQLRYFMWIKTCCRQF